MRQLLIRPTPPVLLANDNMPVFPKLLRQVARPHRFLLPPDDVLACSLSAPIMMLMSAEKEHIQAIFCEKLGGPDNLVLREVDSPSPGPGEVKVALKACGVSYVDVLLIAGQYQVKRPLPFIPGSEAAGIVVQTGPDVSTVQPGDRVLVPAGFAEEAVVAAEHVTPLPDTVSFETAAAFRSNYTTAYYPSSVAASRLVRSCWCTVRLAGSGSPRSIWANCSVPRSLPRRAQRKSSPCVSNRAPITSSTTPMAFASRSKS